MSLVGNNSRVSTFLPSNLYNIPFLGHGSLMVIKFLFSKHLVRPDSFSENLQTLSSTIKSQIAFRFWTISSLMTKCLSPTAGTNYLDALSILKTQFPDVSKELSEDEKLKLERLFFFASYDRNYLTNFDYLIHSSLDPKFKRLHGLLKELYNTCNSIPFQTKLKKLSTVSDLEEIAPLQDDEKLTIFDINLLMSIPLSKKLLDNLKSYQIKTLYDLDCQLNDLHYLSTAPFFDALKHRCMQIRSAGSIFLGDRHTVKTLNGDEFDCLDAIDNVFMGRICHIGIFVNPEGKGLHLSHVNRFTNNHAVVPFRNPLILPFSFSLSLDIKPLIPSQLSEATQKSLEILFYDEFNKQAEETHSELILADTKQHIKMVLLGHQTFFPQSLNKVSYPPENTPTMCSSYVGITFLKAVQKMNQFLEDQNIDARIAHPFGEHENLENMDILRLIYLWKELKIIRANPLNETLAKVLKTTSQSFVEKFN